MSVLPVPSSQLVAVLGLLTFTLLVVQLLVGYRKIKFKGRTHMKVHKSIAWVLIALATAHGIAAAVFLGLGPF